MFIFLLLSLMFTVPNHQANSQYECSDSYKVPLQDIQSVEIWGQRTGQCNWWGMCLYCITSAPEYFYIYWPLCKQDIAPHLINSVALTEADTSKKFIVSVDSTYNRYWVIVKDTHNNPSCKSNIVER